MLHKLLLSKKWLCFCIEFMLTLLHSKRPKLHRVLVILSAIGLTVISCRLTILVVLSSRTQDLHEQKKKCNSNTHKKTLKCKASEYGEFFGT